MTVRLVALVCCLAQIGIVACVSEPAFAQVDPVARKRARGHFKSGQRLYNVSEYAAALAEFKAGFLLHDDPVFLYNIAQCHRFLGHIDDAITFYTRFLRERPGAPNAPEIERRLAELRKEKTASGKPVALKPDGAAVPALAAPTQDSARADLQASPPPAQPVPVVVQQPRPLGETANDGVQPFYKTWWFWTAAGTVVLGGIVAGFALSSDDGCAGVDNCYPVSTR